jgi:hypothetical protein
MYVEYDWMLGVYRFRFGHTFTDFHGVRSLDSLAEVRSFLKQQGARLGRKTDTRSWAVIR